MGIAVAWFRRDLRLADNPAWASATGHGRVCPLFVIDPALFDVVSGRRRNTLLAGLESLDEELRALGGRLRVERGDPVAVVPAVAREAGADSVHINREVTSHGSKRDRRVAREVDLKTAEGIYVHAPGSLLTGSGSPYRVFTPFYRTWSETPIPAETTPYETTIATEPGIGIPRHSALARRAGERAATERLEAFDQDVDRYHLERDRPALDSTSRLSIDLKYGWLGARTVARRIGTGTRGRDAFMRQLAWRDFYGHVLAIDPSIASAPMRHEYADVQWRDDREGFEAWSSGNTGFPIVDAGMRQLAAEGWIHNRVRLLVASFLVKDLLIDWRRGERHLRRHLLDGDVAQNVGNWQWVAGTGADSAPYFRVFNPVTQSKKFDPDGAYIRRWVPEIAGLPGSLIHSPWESATDILAAFGVRLGETYPEPIVDHMMARERAIAAYQRARERA